MVDANVRKAGIGKLLINELENRAWAMGCYKVLGISRRSPPEMRGQGEIVWPLPPPLADVPHSLR